MGDGDGGPIRSLLDRLERGGRVGRYNERLVRLQEPVWELLRRYYFRLEVDGWERLSDAPCLLVGVHSGGALTMDAWTFLYAWWRHFGEERLLHGTAHDVLMATPGLGDYFRQMGVLSASRDAVGEALDQGFDVIVWPGGEKDSMRHWRKRDTAVLGGRTGFVPAQALRTTSSSTSRCTRRSEPRSRRGWTAWPRSVASPCSSSAPACARR